MGHLADDEGLCRLAPRSQMGLIFAAAQNQHPAISTFGLYSSNLQNVSRNFKQERFTFATSGN